MTCINRPVVRETGCFIRANQIVVELQKGLLIARLKGKRSERYAITYADLFEILRWRAAKAAAIEKRLEKRKREK